MNDLTQTERFAQVKYFVASRRQPRIITLKGQFNSSEEFEAWLKNFLMHLTVYQEKHEAEAGAPQLEVKHPSWTFPGTSEQVWHIDQAQYTDISKVVKYAL